MGFPEAILNIALLAALLIALLNCKLTIIQAVPSIVPNFGFLPLFYI